MIAEEVQKPRRSMWTIMQEVAEKHGVTTDLIKARDRRPFVFLARAEFCYRARVELRRSYPQIAKKLGQDHTTVMNAVEKVAAAKRRGEAWPVERQPVGDVQNPMTRRERTERDRARERRKEARRREVKLAQQINSYWREQGKNANATVIETEYGVFKIETRIEPLEVAT